MQSQIGLDKTVKFEVVVSSAPSTLAVTGFIVMV
jgi:hypothetical protein